MVVGIVKSGGVAVASAGTRVAFSSTRLEVTWIKIVARQVDGTTNTGAVFIGDNTVSNSSEPNIPAGEVIEIFAQKGPDGMDIPFDLADVFVDADTNADGVSFWYLQAS